MDGVVAELAIGMIGYAPGNGHPFSFSAIVNGYDSAALRDAGWSVIANYLDRQDRHDIGIPGARVTCCWADDALIASQIARACHVAAVVSPADMLRQNLDAVVIARDDWQCHAELAMPFLRAGIPVFVDKPLTLDRNELDALYPYLESGKLMSCSGLRYARELDELRADPGVIGQLQLVSGVVLNTMDRYGIHLIEAALGVFPAKLTLKSVVRTSGQTHALLETGDGTMMTIHALGDSAKRFRLSFFGTKGSVEVELSDNFSAFRRCLLHFIDQVRSGQPSIPPAETSAIMDMLIDIESAVKPTLPQH